MVATKESGWATHKRLMQQAPEIARFARNHGSLAAAEEFGAGVLTISKIVEGDSKRRGQGESKPLTANKVFLHENGASYFKSLVGGIVNTISDLQIKLAQKEEELEQRLAQKDTEIAELKVQIAKLTSPDGDEEALMELMELVKGKGNELPK